MSEAPTLPWSAVDWADPDGGTIRLWPHLPTVVSTTGLRRQIGEWHGLALLLPADEPEDWLEQVAEEKRSPGINRDALASQGGDYGRMMQAFVGIDAIQTGRFPDPEPKRLYTEACNRGLPVHFLEPEDEDWQEWIEDCADDMARLSTLVSMLFSRRHWKRAMRESTARAAPPRAERDSDRAVALAEASTFAAAWWATSQRMLEPALLDRRDRRFAGRARGSLAVLREGQVDGDEAPVLLLPVMQAWMPAILEALSAGVDPEPLEESA